MGIQPGAGFCSFISREFVGQCLDEMKNSWEEEEEEKEISIKQVDGQGEIDQVQVPWIHINHKGAAVV